MALALSATARGEQPRREVYLRYAAPADCPNERDFFARMLHRDDSLTRADEPGPGVARVTLTLTQEGGRSQGRLDVERRGVVDQRVVEADTCEEVVTALALVAVLSLEASPPPEPAPVEVAPGLLTDASTLPPPAPAPPPVELGPPPLAPRPERHLDVTAGVAVHTAAAPVTLIGAGASVRYRSNAPFAHAFALAFSRSRSRVLTSRAGDATFGLSVAELRACPWLWGAGPVELGPCAVVEGGVLVGSGSNTQQPAREVGAWVAPGLLLDGRLELGRFVLAAGAGLAAPLVRDRFYFEIEDSSPLIVHQAPRLDYRAEVLVGVRLSNN